MGLLKEARLLKSKVVLDLVLETVGSAVFHHTDEEGVLTSLGFKSERWEDMGWPATITVTIEPGDKLNG